MMWHSMKQHSFMEKSHYEKCRHYCLDIIGLGLFDM